MTFDIGSNLTLLGLLFLAFKYLLPILIIGALVLLILWLLPRIRAFLADLFPTFPAESTLLVAAAVVVLLLIVFVL